MTSPIEQSSKRVLEPIERISEVLFGLIMVLTITGSLSMSEAGREDVHTMLVGALGCNLAWGLIDGVMFLMACLSERAQRIRILRSVRKAPTPEAAHRVIASVLPSAMVPALDMAELEKIRVHLNQLPAPPVRPEFHRRDWWGAASVVFLVFLSTFPVVLPFVFMSQPLHALRISNGIAILMLFLTGCTFGRCAGIHPLGMGICMVLLGATLVGLTILLGG